MPAQPATTQPIPPLDYAKMTKVQKLAALLIMLGQDCAAEVLKHLDDGEVEGVSTEMANMPLITFEVQERILEEFCEVAITASTAARGGFEFTQSTLEKALGLFKATDIINRVSPNRTPVSTMQQIVNMDSRQVFNLIKNEHPQMIAVVISYMNPDKAAVVLANLPTEMREQVIERLATSSATAVEAMEALGSMLSRKMGSRPSRAFNQTGGLKTAANMLNALDKNMSKAVLAGLSERKPELAQAIRQKMFSFENLTNLDDRSLQRLMREVDLRQLAVALKTASENLKETLLSNISKRAAESVAEEMTFMGPVKLRDVETAQNAIIDTLRRLEDAGEIEFGEPAAAGATANAA